jgi:hypothetical protein
MVAGLADCGVFAVNLPAINAPAYASIVLAAGYFTVAI